MDGSTTRFPDASLPLDPNAAAKLERFLVYEGDVPPDEPLLRKLIKRAVPKRVVDPTRIALTGAARPKAHRAIKQALATSPVRLHLGSGFVYKDGWVNIDRLPVKVDVPWNLARGIPFPDSTVDAILHEHLMEHLTLAHGFALARESLRVLKPGGVLRVGVPDAGHVVQSYAGNWDDAWARSAPTPMIAISRLFYEHGHRTMYDGQTLQLVLRTAGFGDVARCAAGEGRQQPNGDTPERRYGTLYVEGVKP
jgi:predicted SAM-dependent methyltransferase